jgi:hypothetical protein
MLSECRQQMDYQPIAVQIGDRVGFGDARECELIYDGCRLFCEW